MPLALFSQDFNRKYGVGTHDIQATMTSSDAELDDNIAGSRGAATAGS